MRVEGMKQENAAYAGGSQKPMGHCERDNDGQVEEGANQSKVRRNGEKRIEVWKGGKVYE